MKVRKLVEDLSNLLDHVTLNYGGRNAEGVRETLIQAKHWLIELGASEPLDLTLLQSWQLKWASARFKDRDASEGVMGLVEEVGELAHAELKLAQLRKGRVDARYNADDLKAEARDAVGDILMFLLDYCNVAGISLHHAVADVMDELAKR